jgi:hypothetical protein
MYDNILQGRKEKLHEAAIVPEPTVVRYGIGIPQDVRSRRRVYV